jgi:hypothetical protein
MLFLVPNFYCIQDEDKVALGAFRLPDESFYGIPLLLGDLMKEENISLFGFLHVLKLSILAANIMLYKRNGITFLRELNSPDINTSSPPSNRMT